MMLEINTVHVAKQTRPFEKPKLMLTSLPADEK